MYPIVDLDKWPTWGPRWALAILLAMGIIEKHSMDCDSKSLTDTAGFIPFQAVLGAGKTSSFLPLLFPLPSKLAQAVFP